MNADTCVSYCDMTSMDSYYSASSAQSRDHQANPFRTFQTTETKYSPTFLSGKGSRSPFQTECQSLDGADESNFNKYQLFMQRPTCKTPPEGGKLQQDSGHDGTLIHCYGGCKKTGETHTTVDGKWIVCMIHYVINQMRNTSGLLPFGSLLCNADS